MGVSLSKGQKVSLTKEAAGVSRLMIGLGWDPVAQGGKGILGGLFGASTPNIDCDASVILLNSEGKFEANEDVVYFGRLASTCGSIRHMGDNLTGDGDGDDEQIMVDLDKVPARIHRMTFVVNIYDCIKRKQHFGMIQNAFIRVVDAGKGSEVLRYNLTEQFTNQTALIVGELYRHGDEWKFNAIGEGTQDASLVEVIRRFTR